MTLKKIAEIVETGLLERIANKDIIDYKIRLNHLLKKVDVFVKKNSIELNWSIEKVL